MARFSPTNLCIKTFHLISLLPRPPFPLRKVFAHFVIFILLSIVFNVAGLAILKTSRPRDADYQYSYLTSLEIGAAGGLLVWLIVSSVGYVLFRDSLRAGWRALIQGFKDLFEWIFSQSWFPRSRSALTILFAISTILIADILALLLGAWSGRLGRFALRMLIRTIPWNPPEQIPRLPDGEPAARASCVGAVVIVSGLGFLLWGSVALECVVRECLRKRGLRNGLGREDEEEEITGFMPGAFPTDQPGILERLGFDFEFDRNHTGRIRIMDEDEDEDADANEALI